MRRLKFSALAIFTLFITQCENKKPEPKSKPEIIDTDTLIVFDCKKILTLPIDTVFTDYVTSVEKWYNYYFIKSPRTTTLSGFLLPCNMGDEFKVQGLKVKISGQVPKVSLNQEVTIDVLANGVNLTAIEKVDN